MGRTLVIPAAGNGSRLAAGMPKALVPVLGVPMIIRLLDLYAHWVEDVVIVASPLGRDPIEAAVGTRARVVVQLSPTGMLDAVLAAVPGLPARSTSVWITWCDQIGVQPATVERLASEMSHRPEAAIVMPTLRVRDPYIHFERDSTGTMTRVLHRREGDDMPLEGESDMGLFGLTNHTFSELVPQFAADASPSAVTRERNFLPLIPWVAARAPVVTFPPSDPMEAVGINTAEDLSVVESFLRSRTSA